MQCYEGIDINQAIYEWNYPRQMLQIRLLASSGPTTQTTATANLYPEFLIKRPLLQAIEQRRRPADAADRRDRPRRRGVRGISAGAALGLADQHPRDRHIRAPAPPIVIITRNRTREVHDALKRRCLFYWIDYPSLEKEQRDCAPRSVPAASELLSQQVVAFVQELRRMDLYKLPGVAETLDWAERAGGARRARAQRPMRSRTTLGAILKYQDDVDQVRGAADELLAVKRCCRVKSSEFKMLMTRSQGHKMRFSPLVSDIVIVVRRSSVVVGSYAEAAAYGNQLGHILSNMPGLHRACCARGRAIGPGQALAFVRALEYRLSAREGFTRRGALHADPPARRSAACSTRRLPSTGARLAPIRCRCCCSSQKMPAQAAAPARSARRAKMAKTRPANEPEVEQQIEIQLSYSAGEALQHQGFRQLRLGRGAGMQGAAERSWPGGSSRAKPAASGRHRARPADRHAPAAARITCATAASRSS